MPNQAVSKSIRISQAFAAAVACLSAVGCATQVAAARQAHAEALGATEKCYGVARAGQNDCKTEAHVCAGWAHKDSDPGAFVFVPAGTCERIAGGRLESSRS